MVIDLFSRAILGWKLSHSLHADLVVGATTRAIESGLVPRGAIFHSDRGCQYSEILHDIRDFPLKLLDDREAFVGC